MRIGVLGGTFDPPHVGHLALAEAAIDQLGLDEVIFMPAFRNPIKGRRVTTAPKDRLGMVQALVAFADNPKLALSDLEITRGGPSYTVDSLTELQMVQPGEYWFLLGADSLKTLPDWKQPHRLVKLARLGAVLRPPAIENEIMARVPDDFKPFVDLIHMKPVDISSTDLRDRMARRQNVSIWLPNEVTQYISKHRLYNE